MRNLNIGGDWMDEFVKIASDKGWVVTDEKALSQKTAEEMEQLADPPIERSMFTNEQWSMLKGYIEKNPGIQPRDALEELKRQYPDVFADYSGVAMEKEKEFAPKLPEWMKEDEPESLSGNVPEAPPAVSGNPRAWFDSLNGHVKTKARNEIQKLMTGRDLSQADALERVWRLMRGSASPNESLPGSVPEVTAPPAATPPVVAPAPVATSGNPRQWFDSLHGSVKTKARNEIQRLMINRSLSQDDAIERVWRLMRGSTADDGAVTASVIGELISLAGDLEELGEVDAAIAIDKQIHIYKEALDKLYDVTSETGEQLIEQAHPGGGPIIAPSKEEGGKVETIVEEQKKSIDKATKAPTGKYADLVMNLIATANSLEDEGRAEEAQLVDDTIRDLLETDPFVSRSAASEMADSDDNAVSGLKKEAAVPTDNAKLIDKWGRMIGLQHRFNKKLNVDLPDGPPHNINHVFRAQKVWTSATDYLNDIAEDWKKGGLDNKMLAARAVNLYKKYHWNEESVRDVMSGLYFWDKSRFAGEKLYYKFLGSLKDFVRVATEAASKKSAVPLSTEEHGAETRKIAYIKLLKEVDQYMRNNVEKVTAALNGVTGFNEAAAHIRNQQYEVSIKKITGLKREHINALRAWFNKVKLYKLKEATQDSSDIIVTSGKFGPPSVSVGPATKAPAKKKTTTKRAPTAKVDPNVQMFQQAVMALYGANVVGPKKDDGDWGPKTIAAYNKVMADVKAKYPKARTYPAQATVEALGWGTKVAQFLLKTRVVPSGVKEAFRIEVAPGLEMRVADLKDAKTFMNALAISRKSGNAAVPKVKDEIAATEQAMNLLVGFYKKLINKEYQNKLWIQTGSRDVANKLMTLINRLFGQIYKLPSGAAALKSIKSKKVPAKPAGKSAPSGKVDTSFMDLTGSEASLDSPNGIVLAMKGLPNRRYLAQEVLFTRLALFAARKDKSLRMDRNVTGKEQVMTPVGGKWSTIQRKKIAQAYYAQLQGRLDGIQGAIGTFEGALKSAGYKYDNLVDYMQMYNVSMDQLGTDMGLTK